MDNMIDKRIKERRNSDRRKKLYPVSEDRRIVNDRREKKDRRVKLFNRNVN
ncbi:MAG: hypothetical protein ACE5D0_09050 [Fidelibacterota bacterium]